MRCASVTPHTGRWDAQRDPTPKESERNMPYKPIKICILMGFSCNLSDLCIDSLNNKRYFSSYAASYFSNDYDELYKSKK